MLVAGVNPSPLSQSGYQVGHTYGLRQQSRGPRATTVTFFLQALHTVRSSEETSEALAEACSETTLSLLGEQGTLVLRSTPPRLPNSPARANFGHSQIPRGLRVSLTLTVAEHPCCPSHV